MRIVVDSWDPEYGTPDAASFDDAGVELRLDVEMPLDTWAPRSPALTTNTPDRVVFIDGVRRIEARIWVGADDAIPSEPGIAASWGAGAVSCRQGSAIITDVEIGRSLVTASPAAVDLDLGTETFRVRLSATEGPDALSLELQAAMGDAEQRIADAVRNKDPQALIVVDGPLRGKEHLGIVGMVKSHHTRYLTDPAAAAVLAALQPGQRTPVFHLKSSWSRLSWYVRLPGASPTPMAAVVRCEASPAITGPELTHLADQTAALLPRFASTPQRDKRAPQNLYPIGGLEDTLKHRLGDRRIIERQLRTAAAALTPVS